LLLKPHEYWRWLDHTTTYSEFKKEMWVDTSKVRLLLAEIAKAAQHAQLIVASHEKEKFFSEIPNFFPAAYQIIETTDFDPVQGPTIARRG
jgi:hypothetical protein